MSSKYIRRFIYYHPGLFQDKNLIFIMLHNKNDIDLNQLSRIIVRYRKASSSCYLVLQLKKITESLNIDFNEFLALNRIHETSDSLA